MNIWPAAGFLLLACMSLAVVLPGTSSAGVVIHVPGDKPTIQAGIDAAVNGDSVLVAPGVYPELIDFHGKTITLASEQGARVTTIDGQLLGTVITMQSGEGPATVVQGFTITRGSATFGAGAYVQGTAPTFRQNIFLDNQQGTGGFGAAIGGFSGSPVIESNEFAGNTCDSQFPAGVMSFVNSSSPRIFNNLIHDNPCRAINMVLPIDAFPIVFNNTIVRNRTGISINHQVSNSNHAYRNNLIASNDIGLEVASQSVPFDAIWTNNLVFGNTANFSGTEDSTGTNGNVSADPRFVDSAHGNFHLGPGSAAIDAGTTVGLAVPPTDFDGHPRIQDGNGDGLSQIDIGALEAAPSAAAPVPIDSRLWLLLAAIAILATARRRVIALARY